MTFEGMSGEQFIRKLLDGNPAVAVLATSGFPGSLRNFETPPGTRIAMLEKPFTPSMLTEALGRLLGEETSPEAQPLGFGESGPSVDRSLAAALAMAGTARSACDFLHRRDCAIHFFHRVVDLRRKAQSFGITGRRHGNGQSVLLPEHVVRALGGHTLDAKLDHAA